MIEQIAWAIHEAWALAVIGLFTGALLMTAWILQ